MNHCTMASTIVSSIASTIAINHCINHGLVGIPICFFLESIPNKPTVGHEIVYIFLNQESYLGMLGEERAVLRF